jgi:hypothetical protein
LPVEQAPSKAYLWVAILSTVSTVLKCSKYLRNIHTVVSFQEMQPEENLMIQLANNKGFATIAHQHGIYRDDGPKLDLTNIASTSYLASVCKHIFCWGDYTGDIFRKYTKAKVSLIGRPGISFPSPEEGVLIIFDNDVETNAWLENLADKIENTGIIVSRWYHPSTILPEGRNRRNGPVRYNVIGKRSSILAEMGRIGLRVFLVEGSPFAGYVPTNIIFSFSNGLDKQLQKDFKYPHEVWETFIKYLNQDCLNHYISLIEDINGSNN